MCDALNRTGRPVWYAIHSSTAPGSPNATVANMWRTGGDLSSSSFSMWTNRLDLATTEAQARVLSLACGAPEAAFEHALMHEEGFFA